VPKAVDVIATMQTRAKTHVLRLLMRLTRPSRLVLVYGFPDSEENSLVAVIELADRAQCRVVLLCADRARTRRHLDVVGAALGQRAAAARVEVIERHPVRDVALYVRARLVLYTHGMLDSPAPVGRRVHINIWHGTGAKRINGQRVGAQYMAGCAQQWSTQTARDLFMPLRGPVLPGNVRQDMYAAPYGSSVDWGALGVVGPEQRFVVWLPTYRVSTKVAAALGSGKAADQQSDFAALISIVNAGARAAGVTLFVKPHPLDSSDWAHHGIPVLTNEMLFDAGLSMHQFLGLSAGLISDYSSAWVDYLATDKPICLLCPDLEQYSTKRGLNEPSMTEIAADLLAVDSADIESFFALAAAGARIPEEAGAVRMALDYVEVENRRAALVDACEAIERDLGVVPSLFDKTGPQR
jgi:CDP-glycerol glycerophosphotransferase